MNLTQRELQLISEGLQLLGFKAESTKRLTEIHELADRIVKNQEAEEEAPSKPRHNMRYKVSANYAPPERGFVECAEWGFDVNAALRLANGFCRNPKYNLVEIVTMSRLPNGRWGNWKKEKHTLLDL